VKIYLSLKLRENRKRGAHLVAAERIGYLKPYYFKELVGIALAFGIVIFLDKHFGR
jgi:hypothetical protein